MKQQFPPPWIRGQIQDTPEGAFRFGLGAGVKKLRRHLKGKAAGRILSESVLADSLRSGPRRDTMDDVWDANVKARSVV